MIYKGPYDDLVPMVIRICDSDDPLVKYISKMFPTSNNGSFDAFGRVLSGKIIFGRIKGPNFVHGRKEDLYEKSIQVLNWQAF